MTLLPGSNEEFAEQSAAVDAITHEADAPDMTTQHEPEPLIPADTDAQETQQVPRAEPARRSGFLAAFKDYREHRRGARQAEKQVLAYRHHKIYGTDGLDGIPSVKPRVATNSLTPSERRLLIAKAHAKTLGRTALPSKTAAEIRAIKARPVNYGAPGARANRIQKPLTARQEEVRRGAEVRSAHAQVQQEAAATAEAEQSRQAEQTRVIDVWVEVLNYVSGSYRRDGQPNVAFERMSDVSIATFLAEKLGVFDELARQAGYTVRKRRNMPTYLRDAILNQAKTEVMSIAQDFHARLQAENIISDVHIPNEGYKVLKTHDEIIHVITDYRAAQDAAAQAEQDDSDTDTATE